MFYTLRNELEKRGCFASREVWLGDLDNPAGEHNLGADAFPDFQPEFTPVILTEDSSLVDFIDDGAVGGQGLLVSEKVLNIFGGLKLPPYQPYRVAVVHRGKPVAKKYFWVQILSLDNYGWIDFARSQFTRGRPSTCSSWSAWVAYGRAFRWSMTGSNRRWSRRVWSATS